MDCRLLICMTALAASVSGHSIQFARCRSTDGFVRLWVEHYHSHEEAAMTGRPENADTSWFSFVDATTYPAAVLFKQNNPGKNYSDYFLTQGNDDKWTTGIVDEDAIDEPWYRRESQHGLYSGNVSVPYGNGWAPGIETDLGCSTPLELLWNNAMDVARNVYGGTKQFTVAEAYWNVDHNRNYIDAKPMKANQEWIYIDFKPDCGSLMEWVPIWSEGQMLEPASPSFLNYFVIKDIFDDIAAPVLTLNGTVIPEPTRIDIELPDGVYETDLDFLKVEDDCDRNPSVLKFELGSGKFFKSGCHDLEFSAIDSEGRQNGQSFQVCITDDGNWDKGSSYCDGNVIYFCHDGLCRKTDVDNPKRLESVDAQQAENLREQMIWGPQTCQADDASVEIDHKGMRLDYGLSGNQSYFFPWGCLCQ